jgi:hypothetical protein
MGHEVVRVQVNAWVDVGVAPLVNALNAYPDVVTVDSCEGLEHQPAYVMFTTPDPADLLLVLPRIADDLAQLSECTATLSIDWWYGADTPIARLRCPPCDVDALGVYLRERALLVTPVGLGPEVTRPTQHLTIGQTVRTPD